MSAAKLESFFPSAGHGRSRSKMSAIWSKMRKSSRKEPLYCPLPGNHIRVLQIKTGTTDFPVRVKMLTIDLRNTKYMALSYTSDTQDDAVVRTREVLCGHTSVRVTQNLYNALCQIRDLQRDISVFADALCINDQDLAERTMYAEIMGHIYARADHVIVYLGPQTTYTHDTIQLMRKLVNAVDWRKISKDDGYDLQDPHIFRSRGMAAPTQTQWRQIYAFCHLKWFSQRWGFFQLALAKQALFLWGEYFMEYNFLVDVAMILRLSGRLDGIRTSSLCSENTHGKIGLVNLIGPVARLRAQPVWHPGNKEFSNWMQREHHLGADKQQAWQFFETLLENCRHFECSDLRDTVFAPLAYARVVFTERAVNEQWPRPDYGRRSEEVICHFSNSIARYTGKKSVLAQTSEEQRPGSSSSSVYSCGRQSPRLDVL